LTYRNAKNLQIVARDIPIEHIVIETDSPFLSPHAYRGKRNQPAYIIETLKFLAELKQMDLEEIAKILFDNSLKAFKIKSLD
jgi:TatD DNase family protein